MRAFILAAGEGTRLRPLTTNIPKPLLPLAGRPFLEHVLLAVRNAGIREAVILLGWQGEKIKEYFGDSIYGLKLSYLVQSERLGTAHAVGIGKELFSKNAFLCINGDVIVPPSAIRKVLSVHKKTNKDVMALVRTTKPQEYGVVELDGTMVKNIVEKPHRPKSDLINAGIYVFQPSIFDYIDRTQLSERGEYEITSTLKMVIAGSGLAGVVLDTEWLDVGRPWDLLTANEILMRRTRTKLLGIRERFVVLRGAVQLGKGSVLKSGTYVEGPVIIGENCTLGPNCYVRGSTYIGNNCKIGANVEIKNSIIMSGTHIPHLNYIGDSVIGERCNFGAGTVIANLRLDEKNVMVVHRNVLTDTGRRKFGAIIGDEVKTGINATIDIGTVIGENSFIGPGAIARGYIEPNSRIY